MNFNWAYTCILIYGSEYDLGSLLNSGLMMLFVFNLFFIILFIIIRGCWDNWQIEYSK